MVFTGLWVRETEHRPVFPSVSWTALPLSQVFCLHWRPLKCWAAHRVMRWTQALSGKGHSGNCLCPSADAWSLFAVFLFCFAYWSIQIKKCCWNTCNTVKARWQNWTGARAGFFQDQVSLSIEEGQAAVGCSTDLAKQEWALNETGSANRVSGFQESATLSWKMPLASKT